VLIRAWLLRALRGLAVAVVMVAAVGGGIGWLYALRHVHALRIGPRLTDALPLQRLAGGAAQPLGRIVAAWLPTGIAAGFALALVSRLRRPARGVVTFALSLALVLAAATASDSLTHNEPFRRHLHEQPHRAATWLAALLMALGAVVAPAIGRGAGRHAP
jgi:hypothetical protein